VSAPAAPKRELQPGIVQLLWLAAREGQRATLEEALGAFPPSAWVPAVALHWVTRWVTSDRVTWIVLTPNGVEALVKYACQCEGTGRWCGFHGADACECPGTDCPCLWTKDAPVVA
jgi:hypothetical protein